MHRDIKFIGKNNPRLRNGDFGFDWCDRCGSNASSLLIINTKADEFKLCKSCLCEGINIVDKTILQDCVSQGRHTKYGK